MIRTEMDSMPTELDVINRKIIQMQIEEAALKNEDDELSKARLAELQKELAEQRETSKTLVVTANADQNVVRSGRNIEGCEVTFANLLNTYDVLHADKLVVDQAALQKIQEVFA